MGFNNFLQVSPFSLYEQEKEQLLVERLHELTEFHKVACLEYGKMLRMASYESSAVNTCDDIPFIPVRLFKELSLKSVTDDKIVKIMKSSGTSGQKVSQIFLDRTTSANQQKAMVKIVSEFAGASRMPMIIIDCPSVVKDRKMFSARGAGILGFSMFGTKKIYALNDEMELDIEVMEMFLEQHKDERVLLFGFTFMIWQHFYKELVRLKKSGKEFDLSKAVLIHGGGWKNLISEAVDREEFHKALRDVCGITNIHDYYGMVEQTGCIYMECECGHLHTSVYSDVIIRRPEDFSLCKIGERGIIQAVSSIPESYPGHSLLTEDEGEILGIDDCPCGRRGKYFKVYGRIKSAELRGCSDTFAADCKSHLKQKDEQAGLRSATFLVGDAANLQNIRYIPAMRPFGEPVINFLDDLSKELMWDHEAKLYADIVTLAFWTRKSSVLSLKERFAANGIMSLGRGVVFHIAPANVPVNFAYSLFSGLLCGDANIVRIPSKDFPQIRIINKAINLVLERYPELKPYITLLRYERSKEVNDILSQLCDVRIIWGGDSTVTELRKSPLSPRATEITFADRYSLAIIDCDMFLNLIEKEAKSAQQIVSNFYNDTYLLDQNACTSPRVVVWMGNAKDRAKEVFWNSLHSTVKEKYHFQAIQGIDKLSTKYIATVSGIGEMKHNNPTDNYLVRIQTDTLIPKLMDYRGNSGYFYEYDCDDIMDLYDFCDDMRCQTIGLLGERTLLKPLLAAGIHGVDRVVPIGHTMDFDLIWDGYNLVERLTRRISV